eukprot:10318269-Karenia_brevis.AAC.1
MPEARAQDCRIANTFAHTDLAYPRFMFAVDDIGEKVKAAGENIFDSSQGGPQKATKRLHSQLNGSGGRQLWIESARVAAIAGSAPKSFKFAKSGMRAWFGFAQQVLG